MSSPFGVPTISVEADTVSTSAITVRTSTGTNVNRLQGPNTNERANPTSIYMGSLRPEASNSFLSAGPPRSPTGSFDGVTLHSRSGSLLSPNTKEKSHSDYDNDDSQELEEALKAEHGKESEINIPNNPFAFTPEILNRNLNPKSLAVFKACGGPEGFARGLWTNLETGLDEREGTLEGKVTIEDVMHQPKQHRDRANSSVSDASTIVPPDAAATKGGSAPSKFTPSAPSLRNPDEELGHPLPGPTAPFADRKRIFSDNRLPKKKGKTIWELMWEAYKDPFILVLTGAAVISLALGLYETFGVEHKPGEPAPVDWVEGVAIVVAICIVVIVSAGNDWQKERQFGKLNRKKEDRVVQAVRSGKVKDISVYDILVGDVLMLSQGDLIPADGIVIESNEIKCDESSATGESDQMKKTSAQEVYDRIANISVTKASSKLDPFIISGSKVLEGTGKYLVTSVGVNSSYGKIMMGVRQESEKTPLQVKLEGFAGAITKFGLG